eukprot:768338-Hanusia_phi.AAC.3
MTSFPPRRSSSTHRSRRSGRSRWGLRTRLYRASEDKGRTKKGVGGGDKTGAGTKDGKEAVRGTGGGREETGRYGIGEQEQA